MIRKLFVMAVSLAALCSGVQAATDASISACYASARNAAQNERCLKREWESVSAQYKHQIEQLLIRLRSGDKKSEGRRKAADEFSKANRHFESFLATECGWAGVASGINAQYACKINWTRIRKGVLESQRLGH